MDIKKKQNTKQTRRSEKTTKEKYKRPQVSTRQHLAKSRQHLGVCLAQSLYYYSGTESQSITSPRNTNTTFSAKKLHHFMERIASACCGSMLRLYRLYHNEYVYCYNFRENAHRGDNVHKRKSLLAHKRHGNSRSKLVTTKDCKTPRPPEARLARPWPPQHKTSKVNLQPEDPNTAQLHDPTIIHTARHDKFPHWGP